MNIFFEIFSELPRCGPGDNVWTRRAYESITELPTNPRILDVGCGPGMQTLELARISNGTITAIDTHQPYLDSLHENGKERGLDERITTINKSMFDLDFPAESFDLVWSEGAIYILGFKRGLREWKRLVRSSGYLAVSEAVWLRSNPPQAVRALWEEYPEIDFIEEKRKIITNSGYRLISDFILPESSWWDHYYHPLEARLVGLREKYRDDPEALGLIEGIQTEIDIFREHSKYYGYAFFVLKKI